MSTDMERELERTTALRGFRYGLHDFVAQLSGPEALKKHNDNTEANYLKEGLIERKTKELPFHCGPKTGRWCVQDVQGPEI